MSIKSEYAEKILNGTKCFEYRKTAPRANEAKKVLIYATKPVGKIIGEFTIEKILTGTPEELWNSTASASGLSKSEFNKYFREKNTGFAFKILSPCRYQNPIKLEALIARKKPPQSFCYLD